MNRRELRPYQEAALDHHSGKDYLALFKEMRLGKTCTAVEWWLRQTVDAKFADSRPALLLAPITPMIGWREELDHIGILYADAKDHVDHSSVPPRSWVFATPQLMMQRKWLQDPSIWSILVADESTWMMNPRSQITKLMVRKMRNVSRRVVLAGIPNPETPFNLWSQMAFAMGGGWMNCSNFWEWQRRHAYKSYYDWKLRPGSETKINVALHRDSYVLARRELGDVDDVTRQKLKAPHSKECAEICRQIARTWSVPGVETKNSLEVSTWLRRLAGGHAPGLSLPCWKYDRLLQLLTGELVKQQVVVWFAFNQELIRAFEYLKAAGIKTSWITGQRNQEQRSAVIDGFRKGARRVLLAQLACGKFGLNLSTADVAVYFSGTWSYLTRKQTEARIAMYKKSKPLLYIDMVTDDSADEAVLEACAMKDATASWLVRRIRHGKASTQKENTTSASSRTRAATAKRRP